MPANHTTSIERSGDANEANKAGGSKLLSLPTEVLQRFVGALERPRHYSVIQRNNALYSMLFVCKAVSGLARRYVWEVRGLCLPCNPAKLADKL